MLYLSLFVVRDSLFALGPGRIILFAIVIVAFAVPGGTSQQIIDTATMALRLTALMLTSAVAGSYFGPTDLFAVIVYLRLPRVIRVPLEASVRMFPVTYRNIRSVALAQKSRGLGLSYSYILRLDTYYALVVPYLAAVLRGAVESWVGAHLRPIPDSIVKISRDRGFLFAHALIFVTTLLGWLDIWLGVSGLPQVSLTLLGQ